MKLKRNRGFSLMELMIVVVIVGILAAIALPSYKEYQIRSNKAAAKAVLLEAANRQEQYVVQKRAYATTLTELGVTVPSDVARYYTFSITQPATTSTNVELASMPTFLISAAPVAGSVQAAQATLSINQFGLRMPVSEW